MKYYISFAIIILLYITVVVVEKKYRLPQITLPKGAQHNTIGELPIVEMADDGVFAEIDGAEYSVNSYWCDELQNAWSCMCKFGQSYSVARRIATKSVLWGRS